MAYGKIAFMVQSSYGKKGSQKSDTGMRLELLQYYDYICLDIFRKRHPRIAGKLEKWLTFLSIQKTAEMKEFLKENPGFQSLHDNVIMMLLDREEMLGMMVSIIENEDIMETVRGSIRHEVRMLEKQLADKDEQLADKDEQLADQKEQIADKDKEILRLQEELERLRSK